MKDFMWVATGLGSLAYVLGAMVGASHSPVAGVAITAAFGLAIPVINFAHSKDSHKRDNDSQNFMNARGLGTIGKLLAIFLLTFAMGLLSGSFARVNNWPSPKVHARRFPWSDKNKPDHPINAIDWLLIQDNLLARGYSEEQVETLYEIQVNAAGKKPPMDNLEVLSPFLLYGVKTENRSTGLVAREPPTAHSNDSYVPMPKPQSPG